MDGLALLCNLFADGPVTLGRLRRARVEGLDDLLRLQPAQLAEWLHASVAQAQAFAEEARRLVQRLGPERRTSAGAFEAHARPARAPAQPALAQAKPALAPAQPALAQPQPALAQPQPALAQPQPAPAPASALVPARPAVERASADEPLRPGLLPGLSEVVCARLHEQGVRSVSALVEGAGLLLARRTGIPYLVLLELARLARRRPAPHLRRDGAPAEELADFELVPRSRRPAAPGAPLPEPARSDEFTLPPVEPEAAGPFG